MAPAGRGAAAGRLLRVFLPAVVICGLLAGPEAHRVSAAPATGVEGLAAFRGDFVAGAVVYAFDAAGPGRTTPPVAESLPSDESGRYRLSLPPGRYYLAALRADRPLGTLRLRPGDLYSYYLGNPVVVEAERMTRVGFNLVRIPEEPPAATESGQTRIEGTVLFEGAPLPRAYVHLYRDTSSNFRGMGIAAVPTDADGGFRLRLAPGRYYLVTRKRRGGGIFGPPAKDDYIGYYWGNPVTVAEGETRKVLVQATTRIDLIEELWFTENTGAGWLEGVVRNPAGDPVAGIYVLFYHGEVSGAPAFTAGPTGEDGRFRARAAEGKFSIVARSAIGGPVEAGEWYGLYRDPEGRDRVEASSGGDVVIVVRLRD